MKYLVTVVFSLAVNLALFPLWVLVVANFLQKAGYQFELIDIAKMSVVLGAIKAYYKPIQKPEDDENAIALAWYGIVMSAVILFSVYVMGSLAFIYIDLLY